jgi:mono/diheme cytochrome c family protein
MSRLRWFVIGILATCALACGVVFLAINQIEGIGANQRPTQVETWLARRLRSTATSASVARLKSPIAATPAVLAEAREHWADHCAGCHANNGSGDVPMGKGMYPPAPDMRQAATQRLSDGELFSIIQNGVRLTGMPGWGNSAHDAEASWKLVALIRHLPQLTFAEEKEMAKMNPKSPQEILEEQQEEKFLRGETTSEPPPAHHHH